MAFKNRLNATKSSGIKKYLLVAVIIILFAFGLMYVSYMSQVKSMIEKSQGITWEKNGRSVHLEVAGTPLSRYQGLSDRSSLCEDCGMLFVFSDSSERSFVMRNMKFPLDIIFINNNVVTKIYRDLPPEGNDPKNIYSSNGPADMVLELNAGEANRLNLQEGEEINIPLSL
jgi:uncharacterized membrane protein (UPF0127 family)